MMWQLVGAGVRGAAHRRAGLPNQDAIDWTDEVPGAQVLAVADGHGSARCFRSHIGARLAVEAAVALLPRLVPGHPAGPDEADLRRAAGELVDRWRAAVAAHLEQAPFTAAELATWAEKAGKGAARGVEDRPSLVYGATLLAAVLAGGWAAYLQLGDGDVLAISARGEVWRPLPPDPRLFAGETTSLCSPDARQSFRYGIQRLDAAGAPALVLLSTDGYANSFRDDAGFLRVGADLLALIREHGLEAIGQNLSDWLEESSLLGSGDDVTVGLACRMSCVSDASSPEASAADAERPRWEQLALTI